VDVERARGSTTYFEEIGLTGGWAPVVLFSATFQLTLFFRRRHANSIEADAPSRESNLAGTSREFD
jgi:hypothetical protein